MTESSGDAIVENDERIRQIKNAQMMWGKSLLKTGAAWGIGKGYSHDEAIVMFLKALAEGQFLARYDTIKEDLVWDLGAPPVSMH